MAKRIQHSDFVDRELSKLTPKRRKKVEAKSKKMIAKIQALRGKKLLNEMRAEDPSHPIHQKSSQKYPVILQGEGPVRLMMMTQEQVKTAKAMLKEGQRVQEYPEKLNDLIDECLVDFKGVIDTGGDSWGWSDPGDGE